MLAPGVNLNGYVLQTNFTTSGGGRCRWCFAKNGGKEYFLKEFLSPKYPVEGAPGSAATLSRKKTDCLEFQSRHQRIMDALRGCVAPGGNLVYAVEFFRAGTTYYKATHKIDVASSLSDFKSFGEKETRILLSTITHSLKILHSLWIVHGDLKPENILFQKTDAGFHVAKLIDFDDSYFAGEPPVPSVIVGDQVYHSPELAKYIIDDGSGLSAAASLAQASDIYSLGIVFYKLLTGHVPEKSGYRYPWQMTLDGVSMKLDREELHPLDPALVKAMLSLDPKDRPTIAQVFDSIKNNRSASPSGHPKKGRLHIHKSLREKTMEESAGDSESSKGGLRGSLLRRRPPPGDR